jgi:hypothetical protein
VRSLLLATIALAAACTRGGPGADQLIADAQDQTRRFFALAEGGDCAALGELLARPASCEGLVHQMRETRTHLTAIEGAKLDGRDPHLVLVTVKTQAAKHAHSWIVQAKWTPDGWKVSL